MDSPSTGGPVDWHFPGRLPQRPIEQVKRFRMFYHGGKQMANDYEIKVCGRIPMAGSLRNLWRNLDSAIVPPGRIPIANLQIGPRPGATDLIILQRKNFDQLKK